VKAIAMSFGRLKHLARAATALIALTLTVSCGGDGDSPDASDATAGLTAAATATTAASAQEPVGLLAIGHSGLTGANSNPASTSACSRCFPKRKGTCATPR
jgi:hypothetical protein